MIPRDHQWKLGKYRKKLICWEKFTILRMLTKMSSFRGGFWYWWGTDITLLMIDTTITNQEVFNDTGLKLLMTGSFEGPQVPIDFWLCTKMMACVGMIRCFLFQGMCWQVAGLYIWWIYKPAYQKVSDDGGFPKMCQMWRQDIWAAMIWRRWLQKKGSQWFAN